VEDEKTPSYGVVLFQSISGALLAEKLLKKQEIAYKLIPVPRHLSSDCGVCIRFLTENEPQIRKALTGKVEIQSICVL
jgi:Putative Se/S carrier protein-like